MMSANNKKQTKSPILDKPLRNPGQSLTEARFDLGYDKIFTPVMVAIIFILLAGMEWWHYFHPKTIKPFYTSMVALALVIFSCWRIYRFWPQIKRLNQAIEGEKAVGQFLESLREQGYRVFHDLQGEDFNVDHVIVGPGGVFTIETKTLAKPVRGEARLVFDGKAIYRNGKPFDRDPVKQAKAQASWLKKVLVEYSGAEFEVWPVVVFPGWYVERQPHSESSSWVLEPKALAKWLSNEPMVMSDEQIRLASNSLSRFIRELEKN